MERQCILQLLPLPREIISIIKDYSFYTWIELYAINIKNDVIYIIQNTPYKTDIDCAIFSFWSNYRSDPQFQSSFCKCGNYVNCNTYLSKYDKHACQC